MIINGSAEVLACSAILDGQYGLSGVSIGVPVVLGANGVTQVVELPLSREEMTGLQAAAKKTKDLIHSVSWQQKEHTIKGDVTSLRRTH